MDYARSSRSDKQVDQDKRPDRRGGSRRPYDAFGPGYTLLRLDSDIVIAPLVEAMRDGGIPVEVVDVQTNCSHPACDRKLMLVRTDQHVAWRGDAVPERPQNLADTLRGRPTPHLTPNGA